MAAGFGGAAVSGGTVYLLDRDENVGDTLRVLELASGKELWTFASAAPGSFMFAGSRTTPTVNSGHVYTVARWGTCTQSASSAKTGVGREHLEGLRRRHRLPRWGMIQSPLIYGDLLIVAPQTPEVGVVAYDKLTGAVGWKSAALSGIPGYVAPSIVKVAGGGELVVITGAWSRPEREGRQCQRPRSANDKVL